MLFLALLYENGWTYNDQLLPQATTLALITLILFLTLYLRRRQLYQWLGLQFSFLGILLLLIDVIPYRSVFREEVPRDPELMDTSFIYGVKFAAAGMMHFMFPFKW